MSTSSATSEETSAAPRVWDGPGDPVAVKLSTSKQATGNGTIYVEQFPQSQRVRRAVTAFLMYLVIGAFSVFIPLMHFVLPPVFLIVGIIVASRRMQQTSTIRGGTVVCPGCDRKLTVHEQNDQWPIALSCNGCWVTVEAARS